MTKLKALLALALIKTAAKFYRWGCALAGANPASQKQQQLVSQANVQTRRIQYLEAQVDELVRVCAKQKLALGQAPAPSLAVPKNAGRIVDMAGNALTK